MVNNTPARVPQPQPDNAAPRPAAWPREKKSTRFVIKIGGIVPS